ncbi:MAG: TMEM175 family protein [Mycobacteriales bacterium]|nr:TMEM175 family protein [Frankia sp.]
MTKTRLEAFSDAVIAIIMTVMVLELTVPEEAGWQALRPLVPKFLTYLLSFVFLGIYWSNHHHLIQAVRRVNGRLLWANLHLLFWLSLTPFVTGWMGENDFAAAPTAAYGIVLLLSAVAYYVLQSTILAAHDAASPLRVALGRDVKGKISPVCYAVAIPLAFAARWVSLALYVLVALMWLVPDRRIETLFESVGGEHDAGS